MGGIFLEESRNLPTNTPDTFEPISSVPAQTPREATPVDTPQQTYAAPTPAEQKEDNNDPSLLEIDLKKAVSSLPRLPNDLVNTRSIKSSDANDVLYIDPEKQHMIAQRTLETQVARENHADDVAAQRQVRLERDMDDLALA